VNEPRLPYAQAARHTADERRVIDHHFDHHFEYVLDDPRNLICSAADLRLKILWVASLQTTAALALLLTLLAVTFFLLGAGDVAHNDGLTTIGGDLGLVTAAVAWYACLAGVSASAFGRAVLPNPPLYKL
jgi:hypothetical protein